MYIYAQIFRFLFRWLDDLCMYSLAYSCVCHVSVCVLVWLPACVSVRVRVCVCVCAYMHTCMKCALEFYAWRRSICGLAAHQLQQHNFQPAPRRWEWWYAHACIHTYQHRFLSQQNLLQGRTRRSERIFWQKQCFDQPLIGWWGSVGIWWRTLWRVCDLATGKENGLKPSFCLSLQIPIVCSQLTQSE